MNPLRASQAPAAGGNLLQKARSVARRSSARCHHQTCAVFQTRQSFRVRWPRNGGTSWATIGRLSPVVCVVGMDMQALSLINPPVHCRRRKIRCLLAADDHQNRCSNCIRLKKECNFFPVDQQPPLDRRPRAGSKTEGPSGDHSGSSSASPNHPPGQGMDQMGAYEPPPFMPLNHPYPGTLGPPALSPPGSAGMLSSFES